MMYVLSGRKIIRLQQRCLEDKSRQQPETVVDVVNGLVAEFLVDSQLAIFLLFHSFLQRLMPQCTIICICPVAIVLAATDRITRTAPLQIVLIILTVSTKYVPWEDLRPHLIYGSC